MKHVSFEEVRAVFLHDNPDVGFGSTKYAMGLLEAADKHFGSWSKTVLAVEDLQRIMLPPHLHEGFELIPPCGATVAETIPKLTSAPPSHHCPQRIAYLGNQPSSAVFLSAIPFDHPDYSDYRELVARGYQGITHLDGLHRLLAWGRAERSGIVGYIARPSPQAKSGATPANNDSIENAPPTI